MSERRLLLVHAHPDDESTGTGATMARYVTEGATVSLVTCTSGELGEVVDENLAYLRGNPDALGQHRRGEIAKALGALGVQRHYWLGGAGRWRDSGMAGEDDNTAEDAFAAADMDEAVKAMVAVLRSERPDVVVTYDENGVYGHPDHIAANRVLMTALEPAADSTYATDSGAPWVVPKVYWQTLPCSTVEHARELGIRDFDPYGVPDEQLTAVLDGTSYHATKLAALRCYASQVDIDDGGFFASLVARPEFAVENYVLARGERGPGTGPYGWEDDLFAGLGK